VLEPFLQEDLPLLFPFLLREAVNFTRQNPLLLLLFLKFNDLFPLFKAEVEHRKRIC
jgi:hypothetical protein